MLEIESMSLAEIKKSKEYKNIPRKYGKSKLGKTEICELIKRLRTNEIIENKRDNKHNSKKHKGSWKKSAIIEFYCNGKHTKMTYDELLAIIKESFKKYYEHGERSNEKLKVLHGYIACCIYSRIHALDNSIAEGITIKSLPGREDRVSGSFYDKNVDITIKYNHKVYGVVSVKFIMSNYKQNENNYFENLLGECINLKLSNPERHFWYVMFTFDKIPYFNKTHNVTRYDKFDSRKYDKLSSEQNANLLPDDISVSVVHINQKVLHPNKIDKLMSSQDLEAYVNSIVKDKIKKEDMLDFFKHLDIFCLKIIADIKKYS